jgi:hypothetical protein
LELQPAALEPYVGKRGLLEKKLLADQIRAR